MEREEELEQTIDELNYRLTNALKNIDRLKLSIKQAREEIEEYKKRQLALAIGVEDLEHGKQVALDYVITILDRLIAESEG